MKFKNQLDKLIKQGVEVLKKYPDISELKYIIEDVSLSDFGTIEDNYKSEACDKLFNILYYDKDGVRDGCIFGIGFQITVWTVPVERIVENIEHYKEI